MIISKIVKAFKKKFSKFQTGRVEHFEFTWGGAGNQWTWIDGVRYATYWDMNSKDWVNGDVVTFERYQDRLGHYDQIYLHAKDIKKVKANGS